MNCRGSEKDGQRKEKDGWVIHWIPIIEKSKIDDDHTRTDYPHADTKERCDIPTQPGIQKNDRTTIIAEL